MSFSKLTPSAHRKSFNDSGSDQPFTFDFQKMNPNRLSPVSKLVAEAMEAEVVLPRGRSPQFRPSSFPCCSILNWMKLYRFKKLGNNEEHKYFGMEYYTSVGTTVHAKIQYFAGFTGKFWGNWKCINPVCKESKKARNLYDHLGNMVREGKPTRKHSTNNKCPCCGEPMDYIEFAIKYRGIDGHIDAIIKLDDGTWIVADYKTTSMKKVNNAVFPEKKHLHQLPFYVYALEQKYAKKYGMKIKKFSLIYIPRDNPRAFVEYTEKWNDAWRIKCRNRFEDEYEKWEAINHDVENETFDEVIRTKPCKCESEYRSLMHVYEDCPLLKVCFSRKKLRPLLQSWVDYHEDDPKRLIPFNEVVSIVSNLDYEKKKASSETKIKL